MSEIKIGSKVRHATGAWPCSCDDEDGEVTKLDTIEDWLTGLDVPGAFVGTPCGWQWFPVADLVTAAETNG